MFSLARVVALSSLGSVEQTLVCSATSKNTGCFDLQKKMSGESNETKDEDTTALHVLPAEWYTSDGKRILLFDEWRKLHFIRHRKHNKKYHSLVPLALASDQEGLEDPELFLPGSLAAERKLEKEYEYEVETSFETKGMLFSWLVEILLAKNLMVFHTYVEWLHDQGFVLLVCEKSICAHRSLHVRNA